MKIIILLLKSIRSDMAFQNWGLIPNLLRINIVRHTCTTSGLFLKTIFSNLKTFFIITYIVALSIGLVACNSTEAASNAAFPLDENSTVVDSSFQEFYELLGGLDVVGPAISPKFYDSGFEYQYTSAALMKFDSNSNTFSLAPIGRQMGVADPLSNSVSPGGHDIYHGFLPIYETLSQFIGDPITPIRYNETRGRIEQYFENLGLYQLETDPPHIAHLMYYGAWMCDEACSAELPLEKTPDIPSSITEPVFAALSRIGTLFSGKPLSPPHEALDGVYEQIFENIVVISDTSKPGGIALRPITAMVGIEVILGKEYVVPEQFHQFIMAHSGYEFTGEAVSAYEQHSKDNYRQCFTNICLDYFPNHPEELQVKPTPLGYEYLMKFYPGESNIGISDSFEKSIHIITSEGYSVIAPDVSQLISVYVFEEDLPKGDVIPTLTLTLPGGELQSHIFEATRASDGYSTISLNPIDAPQGTRIDYQVCIPFNNGKQACVQDFFLIWDNR
ncbi:MAG: hypothetical protein ISR58_20085 [Anaerolineales bacterium]|nr:hypothetical protein [Chloroflexota bacterium]MBL6983486.1 hypothetical protein [Anaerolineales bacterium]MBL7162903.1 hypothetical protein [Anaerolineales bacterium]